jgi:hypothetical protein
MAFTYTIGDSSSILLLELAGQPLTDSIQNLIESDLRQNISSNATLYTFESNQPTLQKLERLESQFQGYEKISHQLEISKNAHSENEARLKLLEKELDSIHADTIPLSRIAFEFDVLFDYVEEITYAKTQKPSASVRVQIPTFYVKWQSGISSKTINRDKLKMEKFLLSRTALDTIEIVRVE